jgi:hypothetical protein
VAIGAEYGKSYGLERFAWLLVDLHKKLEKSKL